MIKRLTYILLSVLIIVLFVSNNIGKLYAFYADFNFKKNNMENAQKYYELAFKNGYKTEELRNSYVNILFNSPLNLENQKKLYDIANDDIDDSVRLRVQYFLYDLRKQINRRYPHNYISKTVFNQKVMRWSKMPIKYTYEVENAEIPEYYKQEFEKAILEWEKASDHNILFEKNTNSPNIVIKFIPNEFNENQTGSKYVLAYTEPIISFGKLKKAEINFYAKDINNKYFAPNMVYNTALHELVHALGFMGHSFDKSNIMFISRDMTSAVEDYRAELTEADINTVKLLYVISPEITDTDEPTGEYISNIVFGSDEEILNKKKEEAGNYIKRVPNLPNGYIDLAEMYVGKKEYVSAVKCLDKALTLATTDDYKRVIFHNLAVAHFHLENYIKAENYAKESIKIEETEDLHLLLAQIYEKINKTDEAINEYRYLLNKNPKNIDYTIFLTNLYVRNHKYLKARGVLHNYLKLKPEDKNSKKLKSYGIIRMFL